jgi:class 3 adenylate cyclase
MSRIDCISNRNIKIIAAYVSSKLGDYDSLFEGLPYPSDRYASPDDFFLNEDEWTTYNNFQRLFRKAKEMVGDDYFYFFCGASSAHLRSWGRLGYFERVFASPSDGFKRIPFFNKHFNDTKEIEIVHPPSYDKVAGKIRTVLKVRYQDDIHVHRDYIADPYRRGLLSSIPTIWGLRPAKIRQTLNPYDPEILFNEEPEFKFFALDVREKEDRLTLISPQDGRRRVVGKRVLLQPDIVDGQQIFLGKYTEVTDQNSGTKKEAILITETVQVDNRILLKAGELYKAPYFILDITYDKLSLWMRLSQIFKFDRNSKESEIGLIETIDRIREEIRVRNKAYREVEKANLELKAAKHRLEDYSKNLERKVEARTIELKNAQTELIRLNEGLKAKVSAQVKELERYNELRRYLSPHFAEKILSSGGSLGEDPQRKMMTVVFSDIRDFSSLSDSLEPEEIFQLLDRYISEMTKLIHKYEGTLNKMIGDGLLVFFGDPIPMEDHAERAVKMAVEMQKKVGELKNEWLQYGDALGIGVGINTGFVTVGNIGSDIHKDYTVIGNQVNIASRLESQAKPGQILISQRTYSRVKNVVKVEEIGKIQVKGIHNPVLTYNVLIP